MDYPNQTPWDHPKQVDTKYLAQLLKLIHPYVDEMVHVTSSYLNRGFCAIASLL